MTLRCLRCRRLHSRRQPPIALELALPFQLISNAVLLLLLALHVVLRGGETAHVLPEAKVGRGPQALVLCRRRYLLKLARREEVLPYLLALGADVADQLLLAVIAAQMNGPIARQERVLIHVWHRHVGRRPLRDAE